MEITIRKCGLKVVELIAPEKYRGFIRTVVEVTHGFMLTCEFMINLYLIVLFYKLHSGCAANDPPIKHKTIKKKTEREILGALSSFYVLSY